MERRSVETDCASHLPEEDHLGEMIRWSLEDSVAGAEPPEHVWPEILERVERMQCPAAPQRPPQRRAAFPLASLVQAVVISALLLAFGMGVDQGVVMPAREYTLATASPVRRSRVSEDAPRDVLRGYVLLQMEKEAAQPHRRGYVP
jgi:hypothetical protein